MDNSMENHKPIRELLEDFPRGPLTEYRTQASFDWRTLKIVLEGEKRIRFHKNVWSYLQNNPLYNHTSDNLSLDDQRKLALRRMRLYSKERFLGSKNVTEGIQILSDHTEALNMYDIDMFAKFGLNYGMFTNPIWGLGTERHQKFIDGIENNEIMGCFALTEFSHGSNAKRMQTTATHDPENNQFIIHTANFESAKCWAGNLGKCATHAIVYAKLITSDGLEHGLHAFVVPVRCTKTLKSFPGVTVGDLGEKIGFNGIDNGFVMFNQYRIPAENLLNRLGDIDKDGNYVSPIKDPIKRFNASLAVLSGGRTGIGTTATTLLLKSIVVAVRYAAVRKQFGPDDSDHELSVIEYQQMQYRLFPYLAVIYATKVFNDWNSDEMIKIMLDLSRDQNFDVYKMMEIHAVISASKPTISWLARDGMQVCREACGGHGYLKAAGIGDWRNNNDANCTYDGENSVLIQQTSNWLIGLWRKVCNGENILTPYGNAEFLNHYKSIPSHIKVTSTKDATNPEVILTANKWLICYYLRLITDKINNLSQLGKDTFTIRNDTQSYHAALLTVIFAEYIILNKFYKFSVKVEDKNCSVVLMKLVSLYGLWSLEKHLGSLYMGKFLSEDAGQYIRDAVLELCLDIKPEAVALVDTLAPPDFILNSVLGCSSGYVYQNLQSSIFSKAGTFVRPKWWKEIVQPLNNNILPSKL